MYARAPKFAQKLIFWSYHLRVCSPNWRKYFVVEEHWYVQLSSSVLTGHKKRKTIFKLHYWFIRYSHVKLDIAKRWILLSDEAYFIDRMLKIGSFKQWSIAQLVFDNYNAVTKASPASPSEVDIKIRCRQEI